MFFKVLPLMTMHLPLRVAAVAVAAMTLLPSSIPSARAQNMGEVTQSAAGRDLATASDESDARRRARIRLELATAYYGRGQYTTALDEVKQAITMDGSFSEAFELRALIYDAMGEPVFAEDSYKRAIQINERNGSAHHNYGWFLCRRQEFARADALFVKAATLPNTVAVPKTLLVRGVCQMRAGLLPEAEKTLSRSHELDPSNPATSFNLALVLFRKGEHERARFYARRVNGIPERANAESLWLGARIEHKLGNVSGRDELAAQLRSRFGSSREATQMELGRFDE